MKQYFSIISRDIDRLIRLVGNILNFFKYRRGEKVLIEGESRGLTDNIGAWEMNNSLCLVG